MGKVYMRNVALRTLREVLLERGAPELWTFAETLNLWKTEKKKLSSLYQWT